MISGSKIKDNRSPSSFFMMYSFKGTTSCILHAIGCLAKQIDKKQVVQLSWIKCKSATFLAH